MRHHFQNCDFVLRYLKRLLLDTTMIHSEHGIFCECRYSDSRIWLCGVLHFGCSEMYPVSNELDDAFNQAETVVFETDMGVISSYAFSEEIRKRGTYGENESLKNDLSPEVWDKLCEQGEKLGYSQDVLLDCKPWYCASFMTSAALNKAGLASYMGLDSFLYRRALDEKKLLFLERPEEQLDLLTSIGNKNADEFILGSIAEIQDMEQYSEKLFKLWQTGDWEGLDKLITENMIFDAGQKQQMLEERNRRWISDILNATEDGDVLVVVGAGHIVGNNGLKKMLDERICSK